MVMQIYADVMNRPLAISSSAQTCALGSAVAGAVVAGKAAGGYDSFDEAARKMTGVQKKVFKPIPKNVAVYDRLFKLYVMLHDSFGVRGTQIELYGVMKELLDIRDSVRK